jgi:hypothetical protein
MLSKRIIMWGLGMLCAACHGLSTYGEEDDSSSETAFFEDLASDNTTEIGADTNGRDTGIEKDTNTDHTNEVGSDMSTETGVNDDPTETEKEDDSSLDTGAETDNIDTEGEDTEVPVATDTDSESEGATESDTTTETDPVDGASCVLENTVDDMETGTGHVCPFDNRNGVWYVFNDESEGAEQWPPLTTPGIPAPTSEIPGGRDGSTRAMHTYGDGFCEWGAGIGFDLAYNDGAYGSYDVSAYDGITFWARSDLSNIVTFRVSTVDTTRIEWGGNCEEDEDCSWEPHVKPIKFYADWIQYWVPFTQLESDLSLPFNNDVVTNIQFLVEDFDFVGYGLGFDFWVDDLSFYSGSPDCAERCEAAPPGCDGELPIVDETLMASLEKYAGASGKVTCRDVCWQGSFDLHRSDIDSLQGLECLPWMTELTTYQGEIQDITPLATLSNLRRLQLANSRITRISALSELSSLVYLDLSGNSISDLTPLSGLTSLNNLVLTNNNITDISPLVQNEGFKAGNRIFLLGNPIDCETQAENIRLLEDRGVSVIVLPCE